MGFPLLLSHPSTLKIRRISEVSKFILNFNKTLTFDVWYYT